MSDWEAIAGAVAARYAAASMTAPTGYRAIRTSTHQLPNQLPPLPCVLVFPDNGAWVTGNGTRTGAHTFTVRFYYDQSGDLPRASVGLLEWLTVLADRHLASVQLGGLVVTVATQSWKIGSLSYAGEDYTGIELGVEVVTSEAWGATA